MAKRLKKISSVVVVTLLTISLNTCAGKVEGPAECPIDCSNAINATAHTTVTALVTGVTVYCQGSVVPKVVELLFKIDAPSGEGSPQGARPSVPRSSISFRPVFNGSYDPSRNDHEEAEFKGIATPKDKWCSSKCGLAKINLWPQCEEGVTWKHQFYLTSGPVVSEEVTITATNEDEEEGG